MLVLLMGRIYKVRRWNGFRWHDICTKFHDDRFRYLSNTTVITATIREALMLVSLIEGIYEVSRWDGFMWHDICTKFNENWYRRSRNIKVLHQKFERLKCWYYWWKGIFNYVVEMGSSAMIYVPSFIKIGLGTQKLIEGGYTDTHTDSNVIS
jgi:hypothetical protein